MSAGASSFELAEASYTVTATVVMSDGNTYVSAPVSFTSPQQTVLAQVYDDEGTYTFRLVASPGTAPAQITLSNSCKIPVDFSIESSGWLHVHGIVVAPYGEVTVSTLPE